jgi:hypothetical protein
MFFAHSRAVCSQTSSVSFRSFDAFCTTRNSELVLFPLRVIEMWTLFENDFCDIYISTCYKLFTYLLRQLSRSVAGRIRQIGKKIHLVGIRSHDVPACTTTLSRAPPLFLILVCEAIDTAVTSGLLCQVRVIVKMIVEKQMEFKLAGETEVLGGNLPQRHSCPSQNPT